METVNFLLEGGAKQSAAPTWRPETLALVLCSSGSLGWLQTLRLLHAQGVDLDMRDADDLSALERAAECGEVEAIELLVDLGADPDLADASGWRTPLYFAILEEERGAAEALLRRGADGGSLLLACAERGEYRHVRELAALGADVNTRRSPTAPTPLMILMLGNLSKFEKALLEADEEDGMLPAARSLVEQGADLEAADEHGRTVLLQAANRGSEPACRWLLERGADLEHKDSNGQTALVLLPTKALLTLAAARSLVERGADLEATDAHGRTLLLQAAERGSEPACRWFLECGAVLEHKDSKGQTALVLATKAGHAGVVEHLLTYFARTEQADEHVRTAFMLAAETYRLSVVDVIWQAAATLDGADELKKAARDGALNAGHWDMAEKVEKLT